MVSIEFAHWLQMYHVLYEPQNKYRYGDRGGKGKGGDVHGVDMTMYNILVQRFLYSLFSRNETVHNCMHVILLSEGEKYIK